MNGSTYEKKYSPKNPSHFRITTLSNPSAFWRHKTVKQGYYVRRRLNGFHSCLTETLEIMALLWTFRGWWPSRWPWHTKVPRKKAVVPPKSRLAVQLPTNLWHFLSTIISPRHVYSLQFCRFFGSNSFCGIFWVFCCISMSRRRLSLFPIIMKYT